MDRLALITFFFFTLWLYGGLGLLARKLMPKSPPLASAAAILATGISIATIVSTLAYFAGASCSIIFWILGLGASLSWLHWWMTRDRQAREPIPRPALIALGASVLILLLPPIAGGLQFSFFQGNHHDTFNYLESSLTETILPYRAILKGSPLEIDNAGGFHFAATNLRFRPAVTILYGSLSQVWPAYTVGNHYAFLAAFMATAMLLLASLVNLLSSRTSWLVSILASASVVLGFWGQYVIDINSWSQVAWLPLFLHPLVFWLGQIRTGSESVRWRSWMLPLLSLVAGIYLYTEGAAFTLPCLLLLGAWAAWLAASGIGALCRQLWAPALVSAALLVPIYGSNFRSLPEQYRQATSSVDWWNYFQAFLGGRDGFVNGWVASGADGIAGLLGTYACTPTASTPIVIAASWRAAYLLFAGGLAIVCLLPLRSMAGGMRLRWIAALGCLGILVAQTIALAGLHQYWTAGKGLSFYSLFGLSLILASLCTAECRHRFPRLAVGILAVLIASGLTFGVLRIKGALRAHGIHYDPPYPAIQNTDLKTSLNFADRTFLRQLSSRDYVAIDIGNPWVKEFVQMELLARRLQFVNERPILEGRESGSSYGTMRQVRLPTVRLVEEKIEQGAFPVVIRVMRLNAPPPAAGR